MRNDDQEHTCDAIRHADGRPHRCGAIATVAIRHEANVMLYLCAKHFDIWSKAGNDGRNAMMLKGECTR